MYNPYIKLKNNGVPILSKSEIDSIGENFVRDFQPEVLTNPAPVDIEGFIEFYLEMTPDYQYLSHNGIYLGMTVFNDTDKIPVYDPTTNRAEYISAKARTVIIDNRLLKENQKHRYRFTLGHEAGHAVLHSRYFSYDPNQITLFDNEKNQPMIKCRIDNGVIQKTDTRHWTDHEWMEWQANYISAAVLMPKCVIEKMANEYGDNLNNPYLRSKLVWQISECLEVSVQAATNRLKDLGYIKSHSQSRYQSDNDIMNLFELLHA